MQVFEEYKPNLAGHLEMEALPEEVRRLQHAIDCFTIASVLRLRLVSNGRRSCKSRSVEKYWLV